MASAGEIPDFSNLAGSGKNTKRASRAPHPVRVPTKPASLDGEPLGRTSLVGLLPGCDWNDCWVIVRSEDIDVTADSCRLWVNRVSQDPSSREPRGFEATAGPRILSLEAVTVGRTAVTMVATAEPPTQNRSRPSNSSGYTFLACTKRIKDSAMNT